MIHSYPHSTTLSHEKSKTGPAPGIATDQRTLSTAESQHLLVIALDVIWLNLSLFLALILMGAQQHLSQLPKSGWLFLLSVINTLWIIVAVYTDVYKLNESSKLDLKIRDLFLGTLIYFGILSLIYYHFFFGKYEIHFLLPTFLSFTFLSIFTHFAVRLKTKAIAREIKYVVIGGSITHLRDMRNSFRKSFDNYRLVGQFSIKPNHGFKHLGKPDDILPFIDSNPPIDKVIYIDSNLPDERLRIIAKQCRNHYIDFEVIPRVFQRGVELEQVGHLPVIRRKQEPLRHLKNRLLKRSFDLLFSVLVILFVFPWLFPIIAILIKLDSPGPVLFRQLRTGYWNKPFMLLKFRTMVVNEDADRKQALKDDKRITNIGAFLRKTSLDELPQFLNVLKGDMSVVGPRPHMLQHTVSYSKLIESFMIRHKTRPGITGWAQVSGWRGPTEEIYKMAKRVEFDVNYIENWNIWFDFKCILLTVINMIKGEEEIAF